MKTVYLLFSLCTASFGLVTTISYAQKPEDRLSKAFKVFEADTQFKHAIISLYVLDTKTGKVIFDKNSQLGLAPASCLKVLTSAAAYELLGKDYRYKTILSHSGSIEGDTLKGNFYFTASGDPTTGSWRWNDTKMDTVLQKISSALKEKNIKAITGEFIIDDRKWETQATPRGWTWDDMGNYYGAGARGFNWHENQYDLILKPGKKVNDSVVIVETKPLLPGITLINELKTGKEGSGDQSIIYLPENGTIGHVRGTVPVSKNTFTVSGSMPDPIPPFFNTLTEAFNKDPIKFLGKIKKSSDVFRNKELGLAPATNVLLTLVSPSLDSINYWFLQKSVNLYGEAFVKTIAFEKTGFGSTDTGVNIIKDFWSKNGVERSALNIIDGSGLSPANRVTTNALVTVMQYAKKQNWYPSFYNALPEQNGIKMKSGYIGGVRSYTGYVRSKSGSEYTFSFIINNYDGSPVAVREKMWKLLDTLK